MLDPPRPDPNIITKLPLPSFYSPSFLPSLLPPTCRLTFFFSAPHVVAHQPPSHSPSRRHSTLLSHAAATPYAVTTSQPLTLTILHIASPQRRNPVTRSRRRGVCYRSIFLWPNKNKRCCHQASRSKSSIFGAGRGGSGAGRGKSPRPSGRGGVGY